MEYLDTVDMEPIYSIYTHECQTAHKGAPPFCDSTWNCLVLLSLCCCCVQVQLVTILISSLVPVRDHLIQDPLTVLCKQQLFTLTFYTVNYGKDKHKQSLHFHLTNQSGAIFECCISNLVSRTWSFESPMLNPKC